MRFIISTPKFFCSHSLMAPPYYVLAKSISFAARNRRNDNKRSTSLQLFSFNNRVDGTYACWRTPRIISRKVTRCLASVIAIEHT